EALELVLLRGGRHPPIPLPWSLPEHPVGERRERATVVPKVEPPSAPPGVVCRHLAVDVEVPPGVTHMERQAAGAREPPRLAPPALDEEFAAEQVDPEIPVYLYPKVHLADGDEDRRLRDGVGAEVVQLRSIIIAQRPHKPADGDAEASLVKAHEAHDVALRGLRLGLLWPRAMHAGALMSEIRGSSRSATNCSRT